MKFDAWKCPPLHLFNWNNSWKWKEEMTWNHRIVSSVDEMGNEFFEIAEVYYDSQGEAYAYGKATISSDDIEGIYAQLEWFNSADRKPILKYPEHFIGDVEK